MKDIFFALFLILTSQNLLAKNPISSPTFDNIINKLLKSEKYIFDDKNITVKVPKFADNPVQVPIYIDAKKIKSAKRMILFADLNPIPLIVDMKLTGLLPMISLNIKVAQETPLRALIQDEKNIWHIGSANIKSFGGGCSVSSVSSSDTNFDKYLGKVKGELFKKGDITRIKASIFHPMETGLVFGNSEFYINKIAIFAEDKKLSDIATYSAISENPRFIFETYNEVEKYKIKFYDIDANEFILDIR
ncbi:MAG: quinoprotein dehydrogenase-associated SoxYZ-like carrier [Arcobacter sp.]|uniref:quinoprotein dehydrogenase-associated SoxYZ-like carrier n=1 Tax=Arcobacter sp. TaxID=1872629 RepID=UPI003B00BDF7